MVAVLWIVLLAVLAIWLLGFLLDVAGGIIHLLLIVALVILLVNLFTSRRARS